MVLVIDGGPTRGAMVIVSVADVAVPVSVSVTLMVKLNVPGALGVPLIIPGPDRLRPAGNVPVAIVNVYGGVPPLACPLISTE
jgi:hypothetical protein